MRLATALVLVCAALACRAPESGAVSVRVAAPEPVARAAEPEAAQPALPSAVDLRPRLLGWGLAPRGQGARGTCSVFTVTAALEVACAELGEPRRLSPEFANWAAGRAGGTPSDGNFFHNVLAGFERFGAASEELCPYRDTFDGALEPSAAALDDALLRGERVRPHFVVHWTVPWVPDRFGVGDAEFAELRRVLARGTPVAAGSSHSRLLVGYRDDPSQPGGGVFLTLDSALARFDEVSYAFVRERLADAFWIDALPAAQ